MGIHKEGYKIVRNVFLGLLPVNLFAGFLLKPWIFYLILALSFIILLFVLYFFRKPVRTFVNNENHLLSPADGTIVAIEELVEPTYFKRKVRQVSIFMSPMNMHANFYPVSGDIVYKKHDPGNYWVAWHPKSSIENERTSVVIKNNSGMEIMVRQIAGAVARRIVTYPDKMDKCTQGEELGFIKFGSRVDVFMPLETETMVTLHQSVRSKQTILALLK